MVKKGITMERETLEKLALLTVSTELYYDLADSINETSDSELLDIIKCNGNFKKEIMELYK